MLERGPHVVAVEVKSGPKARASRGMDEFRRRFDPYDTILVGADGIPPEEFLSEPVERWLKRK